MKLSDCEQFLKTTFGPSANVPDEFGITCRAQDDVHRMGYATNLTLEVVESAIRHKVNLIISHHDAWDFVYGMKADCLKALAAHKISHLFAHLPLDCAEFGTAASLAAALGVRVQEAFSIPSESFPAGCICLPPQPCELSELVDRMQKVCGEKIQSWKNHKDAITRIGIVTGGGSLTPYLKECFDRKCNLYITGEKSLYTVQYAQFVGMDLMVGSHTFTEIFGVESLAKVLQRNFPELEIIRLGESHLE